MKAERIGSFVGPVRRARLSGSTMRLDRAARSSGWIMRLDHAAGSCARLCGAVSEVSPGGSHEDELRCHRSATQASYNPRFDRRGAAAIPSHRADLKVHLQSVIGSPGGAVPA
jgi:hypothetical protein